MKCLWKSICFIFARLELVKLAKDVIFGFIFLAIFLYLIGIMSPSFYDWLTAWATQRKQPIIISCSVTNVHPISTLPALKNVKLYDLSIKLDRTPSLSQTILLIKPDYRDAIGFVYTDSFGYRNEKIKLPALVQNSNQVKNIKAVLVVDTSSFPAFIESKILKEKQCPISITFSGESL